MRYLEPKTRDIFKARFVDYQFDESYFSSLEGEKPKFEEYREISWNTPSLAHFGPRTKQCELEVQRIIHFQSIANQMLDAFTDICRITKSHIPAANTPAGVSIPDGHHDESRTCLKHPRRSLGEKDSIPRKKKSKCGIPEQATISEIFDQSNTNELVAPE
ncbi:uncharacterized protein LOC113350809 [Papaver somniferum]|uniref:uncharacterized protein LOC113350809 n=1 Tax=Papaver somniferum TaxID=3469 RepID=UPI000E701F4D|nr:uncharacterized protein LOC113350809 [Papaver somniferum]